MPDLIIVDHPLVQHKLSHMRMKQTDSAVFRIVLEEIAMLLTYELTRDLPTQLVEIETPLAPMKAPMPETILGRVSRVPFTIQSVTT